MSTNEKHECTECGSVFTSKRSYATHKSKNMRASKWRCREIQEKKQTKIDLFELVDSYNDKRLLINAVKQGEEQETTNALLKTLSDQVCELTKKNEELSETASTSKEYVTKYKRLESKHDILVKQIKKQKVIIVRPGITQPRRLEIAASQEWKCNKCSKLLSSVFEIDHIVRWTDSYDDSNENLQALCVECHKLKTAEENTNG